MIDNMRDKPISKKAYKEEGHICNVHDRNRIQLKGLNEVSSVDYKEILLNTKLGILLIKGDNLHIEQLNLDKGNVSVDGKIDAIIYSNKNVSDNSAKSLISRLFR